MRFKEISVVSEPETSTVPGTVFTPRQGRILKIAVIVMGLLLVGGFAFVLAAIVYQASRPAQVGARGTAQYAPGQRGFTIDLPVPAGAAVATISLDGNRLAVHVNGTAGQEIAVIDLTTGKVIAHVRLKPQ
jgi:hypothetical protein